MRGERIVGCRPVRLWLRSTHWIRCINRLEEHSEGRHYRCGMSYRIDLKKIESPPLKFGYGVYSALKNLVSAYLTNFCRIVRLPPNLAFRKRLPKKEG